MSRHPDILAWEHWLLTEEARKCLEGKAAGEYLKNRLWWAFMAARKSVHIIKRPNPPIRLGTNTMRAIQTAIREAVEKGGYGKKPNSKIALKKDVIAWYVQDGILLDPAFWEAYARARGIDVDNDIDEEWVELANSFWDHLMQGRDAESFFAALTNK